ncbi:MAG: trypsin-like peptidase domain-containing protein [Nanoarchaeota archaeon]
MAVNFKSDKTVHILILITILILSIGSIFYLKSRMDVITQDYNGKISTLRSEHDSQINVLNTLISNMQQEYSTKINALKNIVERQQRESSQKLKELEEELQGISVEAGDFSAIIEEAIKGVVSVVTDRTQGSGTIITSDGYIVTNYHVIKDANSVAVVTYNKNIYPAHIIGAETKNDVAVIKINATGLHDLEFGNSDNVKIGEKVIALGNPAGLGFSVTEGIISQKDRVLFQGTVPLIQTDVPVNPGNSGGPLLNTNGKIIGINRLKIKGFEGLGFAIPSNYVAQVVNQIIGDF